MRYIAINFNYEYDDMSSIMVENLNLIYESFEEAEGELPWLYMTYTSKSLPIKSKDVTIRVWRDADIKQDYNYVILLREDNPFFCLNCFLDAFDEGVEDYAGGRHVIESFEAYLRRVLINPRKILKR